MAPQLNLKQIKNELINFSIELGFCKIGIAKAEALTNEIEHFKDWLGLGFQASMSYMERNLDKRENISLVQENAKSVIVLAFNYNTDFKYDSDSNIQSGKVSRYAWGTDYHDIIKKKLILFQNKFTELLPESQSKIYVDTGPILEKIWAERAGIGWQGKNSLVLTKDYGSYIFLSVLICDIEFEPDKPIKNYCGKCTKCIDLCPTQAIVSPKVVDSNKCISYWTIEAKPDLEIPHAIKENINNWVYGCDICQEVCPWNSHLKIFSEEAAFFPRENEKSLEFEKINKMTAEEFSARFKNSPVKRTKLEGLKRNARACSK